MPAKTTTRKKTATRKRKPKEKVCHMAIAINEFHICDTTNGSDVPCPQGTRDRLFMVFAECGANMTKILIEDGIDMENTHFAIGLFFDTINHPNVPDVPAEASPTIQ